MQQEKQIRLTSAEIAQLWSQYLNDSAIMCMLSYFLEKVEDGEIKPIIEYALQLSNTHLQKISEMLTEEKNIVPQGFRQEDNVDVTAPRLFSDTYVLHLIHQMSKIGLTAYANSLSLSVRQDITDHYKQCMSEIMKLYEMSKNMLLEKGLYVRSPYFPNLEHVDFVVKQSFIIDFFGEKRPLSALEVSNLYANSQRNALGIATLIGFSQVAKSKEVTQYFLKGIEIAQKHIELFDQKLKQEHLPVSVPLEAEVTNTTAYVFSEKLMMYFVSTLISIGLGFYGTAISQSPRLDLGVMYNKMLVEIQFYSEDGANIMIKNKWLEQPPLASNRKDLAKKNFE
ncbi:hypothetical protein C0966_15375 [Bacillus methanolicus]|uniref:DUF3231 family protein n=1 Tax=Bacillus methanolicus TaxID=1471 RepID=UPI0023800DF3|nr:DUF3231 family protein [Bacillus methanolicus]MDE3840679.1 hypothetical protein [Bacillus methanolicus]